MGAIEEARLRVAQELEGKECKNVLSIKIAERFAEIKNKAETCNNVATLQNIKVEADALKVRLLNEIADTEAKIVSRKQAEEQAKTAEQSGTAAATEPATTTILKQKKQKTVSIKSINTEATWRIETANDVDSYIESLREKLKRNLEDDTILNIEF